MSTPGLSESDYDLKLREMGNYLWELDQAGDLAHQAGDHAELAEIERKMANIAQKAARFCEIDGSHLILASMVKGLALRMLKRWEEATQAFLDVLEANPMNGEAWLELTWALGEQGNWRDAENAAQKGVEIFPAVSAAWGNLAEVQIHLGQRGAALTSARKACDLDAQDPRNIDLLQRIAAWN